MDYSDNVFKQSPKQALKYYWIKYSLYFVIEFIVLSVLTYFWYTNYWYHWLIYIAAIYLVLMFITLIASPYILYHHRYYRLDGNNIEIKKTYILKKHKMSKIERVQQIEVKSNPLLYKLKLNKLIIPTAGHEISFPIVSEAEALRLQDKIIQGLRGVDTDV